jgi:GTA TIM-barrel-like domain/Putative phage tail protein
MTTIVLRYAGTAIGTALGGPIGGVIGGALGAIGGNIIDQRLFGQKRRSVGPRLDDLRVMGAQEGSNVPLVLGRARVSGQMIWATQLEEVAETTTQKSSAKGAPKAKSTEYKYFANFAIGLCEGEIGGVNRVWADGRGLDISRFAMRTYTGSESQMPDSLLTAVQGAGNVPAYRGLAYVVFERLPLAEFGNRIPQLSFEVWRSGNDTADKIRALTIIPGATEFGYDTTITRRNTAPGQSVSENAHMLAARSDLDVSLDQAQMTCSELEAASLVVSWFGNDLRCGSCNVRPQVERSDKTTTPDQWSVSGLTRTTAAVSSEVNAAPAFGGTPSDASVLNAIAEIKARGLKVMFYPFVMMDIATGNALPDPYGGATQPAYPWRGRLTTSIAPGRAGTPDKTAAATTQIANFLGAALPSHFTVNGTSVSYGGPAEWSYRRMILHYAKLCAAAGGVDAFLIGSEMRGLSTLRGAANSFPFVAGLIQLAQEVKAILPAAKISYAADWTEYFGYHPADGSNDHFFHLDSMWSDANIDFIGVDNYAPLADWREGRDHLDAALGAIHNTAYLAGNIAGGEGFDWYYATDANRKAQVRTPIADGAYGKPWMFRYKDLKRWWQNAHYNRIAGVEQTAATSWVPQSKPFWFTEIGCPAIDKGANAPNLFVDAKSSENGLPPFSEGQPDALMQIRFLKAVHAHWQAVGEHNPNSSVYGTPMVDSSRMFCWAWDARPYPAFPARSDVWADAENYWRGHWLNGRLGAVDLADLVRLVCARHGLTQVETSNCNGMVDGFVIDRPMAARAALQDVLQLFAIDVTESGGAVVFRSRKSAEVIALADTSRVEADDARVALEERRRQQETDLNSKLQLAFIDEWRDFAPASVARDRRDTSSKHEASMAIAASLDMPAAQNLLDALLEEGWTARETINFAMPPSIVGLEPGDVMRRDDGSFWHVKRITDGVERRVEAQRFDFANYANAASVQPRTRVSKFDVGFGSAHVVMMDLATTRGISAGQSPTAPWVAAAAKPWPGTLNIMRDVGGGDYQFMRSVDAQATMGRTQTALATGITHRVDWTQYIDVKMLAGALSSAPMQSVLNGANAAAIGNSQTGFEIIQFANAELISPNLYRLRGLLRAQAGSLAEMLAMRPVNEEFILLNAAVFPTTIDLATASAPQNWRVGPAINDDAHSSYVNIALPSSRRGLRPLSPAQVRVGKLATGLVFSWIRRTRSDGDSWDIAEVPLGEETESYNVEILNTGGAVKRVASVALPHFNYATADMIADFGAVPATLKLRVAQINASYGAGTPTEVTFNV